MEKAKKMFARFNSTFSVKDMPRPDFDLLVYHKKRKKVFVTLNVNNFKTVKPLLKRLMENAESLKSSFPKATGKVKLVIICGDKELCEKEIIDARKIGVSVFDQKWMDYFIDYEVCDSVERKLQIMDNQLKKRKSHRLQEKLSKGLV